MLATSDGGNGHPLRLLVVTPGLPRPDQNGGDLRLFSILSHMAAKHHHVVISPLGWDSGSRSEIARYREMFREAGVRVLPGARVRGLRCILLEEVFDVVIFESWVPAEEGMDAVARIQPWARVVVDTVDIHFRREEGALSFGMYSREAVDAHKRRELSVYRKAHAVLCVSDEDGRFLDAEGGIARWFTIPNVVPERHRSERDRRRELLFLGGFGHPPNTDGLLWFVRETWPAIRKEVPDATLTIIGSNPTPEILELARVDGTDVVGFVPDTTPYLDRAALMVAPLRFGAGVKNKVQEAMSAGLPVVTTTVGAQGLDVVSGEHLMIADEPPDFARDVVDLLRDPQRAQRIAQAGRESIARTWSPRATFGRFEEMLAAIIDQPPSRMTSKERLFRLSQYYACSARLLVAKARKALATR